MNSAASGIHFHACDGNGNVVALVKASDGTSSASYEYGPFGEPLRVTGAVGSENSFRFSTTRANDTLGLVLYEYRVYNPDFGRWLSGDPLEESGGLNLSGFAGNNAIGNYDVLGQYYTLSDMQAMLLSSMARFRGQLNELCPCVAYKWSSSVGVQTCTRESCLIQADVLARDFARYLKATFTAQYRRFGNVIAFNIDLNVRAHKAPNEGMNWHDYEKGYGLKCQGMQGLMRERFRRTLSVFHGTRMSCFKGADVGNSKDAQRSPHNWFAIYAGFTMDATKVDVHVDPWYSAGGIISPRSREFGEAAYFHPAFLW